MSRKNVLAPKLISANQSLAADFTSPATIVSFEDNVCYQLNVTTTNSTGNFYVQASLDYNIGNGMENAATGNWIDLTLDGVPTVAAANDNIIINLNQVPFRALRIRYDANTAGTGTVSIYVSARTVGA